MLISTSNLEMVITQRENKLHAQKAHNNWKSNHSAGVFVVASNLIKAIHWSGSGRNEGKNVMN